MGNVLKNKKVKESIGFINTNQNKIKRIIRIKAKGIYAKIDFKAALLVAVTLGLLSFGLFYSYTAFTNSSINKFTKVQHYKTWLNSFATPKQYKKRTFSYKKTSLIKPYKKVNKTYKKRLKLKSHSIVLNKKYKYKKAKKTSTYRTKKRLTRKKSRIKAH